MNYVHQYCIYSKLNFNLFCVLFIWSCFLIKKTTRLGGFGVLCRLFCGVRSGVEGAGVVLSFTRVVIAFKLVV